MGGKDMLYLAVYPVTLTMIVLALIVLASLV